MKKAVMLFVAAVAACRVFAAWEKVAEIQIADKGALTQAAMKLGELTGNQMIGSMLAANIPDAPHSDIMGAMRVDSQYLAAIYLETDMLSAAKLDDAGEGALLYPATVGKDGFLAANPAYSEKDGVCTDGEQFVAFSGDGKWAGIAKNAELAKKALGEIPAASAPMKGSLVRVAVPRRGIEALRVVVDEALKTADATNRNAIASAKVLLDSINGLKASFTLGDKGADVAFVLKIADENLFAGVEKGAIASPLAFADKSAFYAGEHAADVGCWRIAEAYAAAEDVLRKHEIELSQFIACGGDANDFSLTIDIPAMAAACMSAAQNPAFDNFDPEAFKNEYDAAVAEISGFEWKGPAQRFAYRLKDREFVAAPGERFAATLPDVKDRQVLSAGFISVYGLLRAAIDQLLPMAPQETFGQIKLLVAQLPVEPVAGSASAGWRDGDKIKGVFRISADEIKGIASIVNAAMGAMMAAGMQ